MHRSIHRLAGPLRGTGGARGRAHKGGLPRGLQTGAATIAVFLCQQADEETKRWFATEPKHRFAAMRFPVLAEPETGELSYFKGRWTRGSIYSSHIVGTIRDVIAPALRRDT